MQKRKFLAVVAALVVLTAVGCNRKGTGCPTFSKAPVEQNDHQQV